MKINANQETGSDKIEVLQLNHHGRVMHLFPQRLIFLEQQLQEYQVD